MHISQIYVYPIKSLRPVSCQQGTLTSQGFAYDRHFMLLKVEPKKDGSAELKPMSVANFYETVRFFTALQLPSTPEAEDGTITVTYRPVHRSEHDTERSLTIPLKPATAELEKTVVNLHKSATQAFRMPQEVNQWFSECFKYDVVLAYLGPHRRSILSSTPVHDAIHVPKGDIFGPDSHSEGGSSGWLTTISNWTSSVLSTPNQRQQITFADVAPYLLASAKSIEDVSARLPATEQFDITKFRPNIVVSGADIPWEEDYWGELTISSPYEKDDRQRNIRLFCKHNCNRCRSINVDYDTAAQGEGESGKILKLLQRDRRVDQVIKHSPVFGRYSYLATESEGAVLRVGDEVKVAVRNTERSGFGKCRNFNVKSWKKVLTESARLAIVKNEPLVDRTAKQCHDSPK